MTATPFTPGASCERESNSPPTTTCCKPGEDFLAELLVEGGLDQQHVGRLFEAYSTFLAAILSGIDRDHLLVQCAVGILLADQLAGALHGPRQTAQPRQPPPERAVCQRGASGCQRMLLPIIIDERPLLLPDPLTIRLGAAQKVLRPLEHRGTDKLLASQSERADSR